MNSKDVLESESANQKMYLTFAMYRRITWCYASDMGLFQFKAVLVCMVGVFVFSALDENVYFSQIHGMPFFRIIQLLEVTGGVFLQYFAIGIVGFTLPEVDRNGKFSYTPFIGSVNVVRSQYVAVLMSKAFPLMIILVRVHKCCRGVAQG